MGFLTGRTYLGVLLHTWVFKLLVQRVWWIDATRSAFLTRGVESWNIEVWGWLLGFRVRSVKFWEFMILPLILANFLQKIAMHTVKNSGELDDFSFGVLLLPRARS